MGKARNFGGTGGKGVPVPDVHLKVGKWRPTPPVHPPLIVTSYIFDMITNK